MADRHEEQLLNDLLREAAHDDKRIDPAGLEARVLAAWDAREPRRPTAARHYRGVWAAGGIAAALLLATALPASHQIVIEPLPAVRPAVRSIASKDKAVALPDEAPGVRPTARSVPAQPRVATSPMEFVPLMPMTGHELAGSFQIVRVQMPRASLGALGSPLDPPNALVEADVLLGEDGIARGIRLSTSGSLYPRRSR